MFKKIIIISFLVLFVCSVSNAFSPMGYPWFTWGDLTYQTNGAEDGFKGEGYLEQGVDWFPLLGWTANTFVGVHAVGSDDSDQYWNNKFGIMPGVKFKRSFNFGEATVLEVAVGYRWEYYAYFDGHDSSRGIGFGDWYIAGNWAEDFPWHSWGEISNGAGDPESSFKVDAYIQQGYKLATLGQWTVMPYIGARVVQSDSDDDYWNNKIGPRFGLEFQHAVGKNGSIAIGARGDYYTYNDSGVDDELIGTIYLTWWFAGDHKNNQEGK